METKYSKTEFEGYTHRFMVVFRVNEDWRDDSTINIYCNNGDKRLLHDFINEKKSDKAVSYEIVHMATKEQDDMASKLIDEAFGDI